ncbi:MAG: hypothetical protein JNM07_09540 [Phycisphaerae bacterium]|nr:hypothetical protein [Phycisphaerae bacterium]
MHALAPYIMLAAQAPSGADPMSGPSLWLGAAIATAATGVALLVWAARGLVPARRPTQAEATITARDLKSVMTDARALLEQLARDADARAARLESLIASADARLDRLIAATPPTGSGGPPTDPPATDPPAAALADATRDRIIALARAGRSSLDIAEELGQHVGVVELVRALHAPR